MTKDEALKLALEAFKEINYDQAYANEITAIKEALAQPEQEPVAWQRDVIVVNLVREGINKHRARELAEHFSKHTTPPQRKPLTDEEREEIALEVPIDAVSITEAKLKQKNT